jgi:hypothetical protein
LETKDLPSQVIAYLLYCNILFPVYSSWITIEGIVYEYEMGILCPVDAAIPRD